MITYDMINEFIKTKFLPFRFEVYKGKYGTGIAYPVRIKDYGTIEFRLAIFNTLEELERFLVYAKHSDNIVSDTNEIVNSNPTFYLGGRKLTDEMIKTIDENKHRDYIARRRLSLYIKKRGQIMLYKIEKISDEIQELKKIIENNKKKSGLLFNNELEKYEGQLKTSETIEIEDLPEDMKNVLYRDIPNMKYKYKQLEHEKNKLEEILEKLIVFSKKSFFEKLILSQKTIDEAISNVEKANEEDKDEDTYKRVKKLEDKVYEFEGLFSRYEVILDNFSSEKYYQVCLEILKKYDEIPIERLIDLPIDQLLNEAKDRLNKVKKELLEDINSRCLPTEQEKMNKLFEKLKIQYDKNINDEQKNALIIYNSRLFEIINKITGIPNYQTMDSKEILEQLKLSPRYNEMITILHIYGTRIKCDDFYKRKF